MFHRDATSDTQRRHQKVPVFLAPLVALSLLVAACGGGDDPGSEDATDNASRDSTGPTMGGDVTYALEAETSGGFCIPEAQLAISGMMVAWAIYDFLFVPSKDDGFVPFLAESMEPDEDATEWTLTLRKGIKFHDGSDLDATVVKNNLDASLGRYPARASLLGPFTLANVDTVEIIDDLTLSITTKVPWPALPAYLYGGGRNGIMAQAQLDDPDTCDRNLIGTGPYEFEEWAVNDHLTAVKNKDYWRKDHSGVQLPYLDSITFKPVPDPQTRANGLLSGEYDLAMSSSPPAIETFQQEADAGNIDLYQTSDNTEVNSIMFNEAKAPFDDLGARKAVATALDRPTYEKVVSLGLTKIASGPFPPGAPGYVKNTGFPDFDLDEAKELVADYESRTGHPLEFTYAHVATDEGARSAQFIQEQLQTAGMLVNLKSQEQATLINTALGGDWQAMAYRNFPGGVPDGNYVWWYTDSPVNFGNINDSEIDRLLTEGRSELDPDKADRIYEDLNRRMAEQVHFGWLDWTLWTIGHQEGIHGILGPALPGGEDPSPGVVTGHATSGIYKSS